jgi:hypothetical protein
MADATPAQYGAPCGGCKSSARPVYFVAAGDGSGALCATCLRRALGVPSAADMVPVRLGFRHEPCRAG